MITRTRVAGAAVALLFALAAMPSGGAGAATLGDKGWWWFGNAGQTRLTPPGVPGVSAPAGTPETPPPRDVPENGLLVERSAPTSEGQQTTAIAAVRFELSSGETSPILELKAASTAGTPALLACIAGSAWTGTHGGRWDYKPLVACDPASEGASVAGVAGAENVWTFNLSTLVVGADEEDGGGTVDVVIVPQRDPAAAAQPPFRIVFEAVTQNSLKTTMGGSFGGGFELSEGLESALELGTIDSSTLGEFTTPTDSGIALVEPDLPSSDQGLSPTAPAVRASTDDAVIRPTAPDDGAATAAAIFVILCAAAAAYYGSQQSTPRVQGLIPVRSKRAAPVEEAVRVGGLGRFARPRVTAPIRLG
ncbi:MAG: hypothetical protein ACLGHT_03930 [Acidimicrobiia bacterium]